MCNKCWTIVLVLSLPVLSFSQEKADQSKTKTDASEKTKVASSTLIRFGDGEVGSRLGRPRRWFISMNYEVPQEFIKKISELKITIGAARKDGKFLVFQDMPAKPPIPFQEMDQLK